MVQVFAVFDADGSGSIDVSELGSCLRALGQVHVAPLDTGRACRFLRAGDSAISWSMVHGAVPLADSKIRWSLASVERTAAGGKRLEGGAELRRCCPTRRTCRRMS